MKSQLTTGHVFVYTIGIIAMLLIAGAIGDGRIVLPMLAGWMMLHLSLMSVSPPLPK